MTAFSPSEDQLALAASVRDFLADAHGPEILRELDAGRRRAADLWPGLVDMGLTGVCAPEAQGGLGLGLVQGALVALECGRTCLAGPLVDTAFVAAPWLAGSGCDDALAAIAAGEMRLALAHPINPWIAGLDEATHVLAPSRTPPLAPASEVAGGRLASIDPLRVLADPMANEPGDDRLLDLAALMSAAQLAGLADAMLVQATEYAKVRQQFGQPIGAFQAVKHQLASAMVAIEFAKPVVWRAAQALETGSSFASVAVSHAKVAATDAAVLAAETAIQVHGAMGYTYEVDLHFWMKRCWALAGAWGDRSHHLRRIDAAVIDGAMPIGPDHTFA